MVVGEDGVAADAVDEFLGVDETSSQTAWWRGETEERDLWRVQ